MSWGRRKKVRGRLGGVNDLCYGCCRLVLWVTCDGFLECMIREWASFFIIFVFWCSFYSGETCR